MDLAVAAATANGRTLPRAKRPRNPSLRYLALGPALTCVVDQVLADCADKGGVWPVFYFVFYDSWWARVIA